ncbi:MAG TPA: hypothetical protein ENN36_04460 [Candidatus Bathyarchaeota archaeon]|nr:hypothetical protein [Candidatus Bathyarchaeota archaeon]
MSLELKNKEFAKYKGIIQYSLFYAREHDGKLTHLNAIGQEEIKHAKDYARRINQPKVVRWLTKNESKSEGQVIKIPSRFSEFSPPQSTDPLINASLKALIYEFFSYLEANYVAVHYSENQILFEYFTDEDFTKRFHEFLKEKYDNSSLKKRWGLVKGVFRLRDYYNPIDVRDEILTRKIPLEIPEFSLTFGDDVKNYCFFCGRPGEWKVSRGGFVDFAQQRPQSRTKTRSILICPVCLFSSIISLVRTSEGAGAQKSNLIALQTTYKNSPVEYVYNRLFGLTTGHLVTIQKFGRLAQELGMTLLTHLSASLLHRAILLDANFRVVDLSSLAELDTKKVLAIKAFEPVLGLNSFWRFRKNSNYRKAHYEIHRENYYAVFGYIAELLSHVRWRKKILEESIYKLLRYGVIKMNGEPEIIFGTALLIDAFMPEQWQKGEEIKTETRKVAFYLEKPEEVLLRLRQIRGKDYAIIIEDFRNKASFMLLKTLLTQIYEKENYGDFDKEQKERKSLVEKKIGKSFGAENRLFVGFDDVIKVYLYIQQLMKKKHGPDPKRIQKKYSDFMSRIKYALIARRPELAEGGD